MKRLWRRLSQCYHPWSYRGIIMINGTERTFCGRCGWIKVVGKHRTYWRDA